MSKLCTEVSLNRLCVVKHETSKHSSWLDSKSDLSMKFLYDSQIETIDLFTLIWK